jgi:hypothetical protein
MYCVPVRTIIIKCTYEKLLYVCKSAAIYPNSENKKFTDAGGRSLLPNYPTDYLIAANFFLNISLHSMEPECSAQCSQRPPSVSCPEPHESEPNHFTHFL